MQPRDHLTEARRWAKFPATVLLITGLLWLLQSYFALLVPDARVQIGQETETFLGALYIFSSLVIVPLGSVAVGLGLLFVQRWALWGGFVLPALALVIVTAEKAEAIGRKFTEFRQAGTVSSFGGGVMTALLVLALWAVYLIIVLYLLKTLHQLNLAYGYARRRQAPASQADGSGAVPPAAAGEGEEDDFCLYMPETQDDEED
jgi:hypothetical protein